jgi:hypothetical protein
MLGFLEFCQLLEDGEAVPVNNAGGGNIAGIGVGSQGEPGIKPKKKKTKAVLRGILSTQNIGRVS